MTDFASINLWDDADATSINPICLEDILEDDFDAGLLERKEKKKRSDKKKRRRRRKKASEEDASVADSMLSELLSEDENEKLETMPTVDLTTQVDNSKSGKQRRRERIEQLKAQKMPPKNPVQPMRESLYPSSDDETKDDLSKNPFSDHNENNEVPVADDDLSQNPFSDHKETTVADDDLSMNPFSDHKKCAIEDDDLSKNPFSDHNKTTIDDDDLSKNPFSDKNAKTSTKNPFGDDSIRDRAASDSEESSAILPPPKSTYIAERAKEQKNTNPFEDEEIETVLQEPEQQDSDEDIIESSKRLLRCVDQRIQYQQNNDTVHSLKKEVKQLKLQAEAMAEQLRRAVETKCDLVLAQNEMERTHEQQQIANDAELKDLRLYIQEILEQQAQSEMNFMNEISSLARTLESNNKKHTNELEAKESKIFRLETKIESMKVASVRNTSNEAFKTRFTNASGKSLLVFPSFE